MTHKARVRFFLESQGYGEDYIQSILEQIPDPKPRRRKAAGDDGAPDDGNDNEDEEDSIAFCMLFV